MLLSNARRVICLDLGRTLHPLFKMQAVPNLVKNDTKSEFYSTKSNPQSLPLLPVPPLKDTLAKYLKSVEPFLTSEELNNTENLLKEFSAPGGEGEKLQCLLEERAKGKYNWLESWWLDTAYLGFRWPVVVHSSPGMALPAQSFRSTEEFLDYASKVVCATLDFKLLIDKKAIPVDKMGKRQLDMQQYNKLLGTCRIPGLPKDNLSYNTDSNHIVVCYKSHYFKLKVLDEDGRPYSTEQFKSELSNILELCPKPAEHQIGLLSSDHRDNWAKAFNELMVDDYNAIYLKEIESSLFVLCLDEPSGFAHYTENQKKTVLGQQTIHGGGSKANGGNRWYDKTLQIIVGADGIVGFCYEHSPAEGQPIAVLADFIVETIKSNHVVCRGSNSSISKAKRMKFNVNDSVKKYLDKAAENLDLLASDLEVNCFQFGEFGKEFIKSTKLSPDSFIQMAMQYAFYRLHKTPGAHYESAATRMFVGGRTETIRSCSNESIAFAKAMVEKKDIDRKEIKLELVEALRKAIESHKNYTVNALQGLGVDRHLLGLRLIAKEHKFTEPKLFQDVAFTRSTHMRLSTSQVACKCDGFMVYGPLVPDGYATCYNPRANDINFGVSAFRSNKETNVEMYVEALQKSLSDMKELLLTTGSVKSKL